MTQKFDPKLIENKVGSHWERGTKYDKGIGVSKWNPSKQFKIHGQTHNQPKHTNTNIQLTGGVYSLDTFN